jgi:spore germination protein YaaH
MTYAKALYLTLLALLTFSLPVEAQRSMERLFYYYDNPASWESLRVNIDQISIVAPGGYSVDEDGIVWGEVDARVLRLAREHNVPVIPLVVNPGFNQETLHRLLNNEAARRRAIATLVEECRRHGYHGIQVDFENLSINDRDAFTSFYRELATELRRGGFGISAAVVHRPDELAGPTQYHKWLFRNWRAGYDLKAIGEIGDFVSIMSYNQHTRRTPPGPQHGMPWMREVIDYFRSQVPAGKLSLGIITGGMRWYTSQEDRITPEMARSYSNTLSHAQALGLLDRYGASLRWDDEQQVSYTYYSNGGTFEWLFLEDARSFAARVDLVDEYQLRGFSVWVLGPEDPGIWDHLRTRGWTR